MKHTSTYLVVLLALLLTIWKSTAAAEDVWTDPYPGVRHLHRIEPGFDYHVLLVDLQASEVSMVATRPEDRSIPVGEFARKNGAEIAFNANYFDAGYHPCGMAAGDGVAWPDAYEEVCNASIGFGGLNEALAFDSTEVLRGPFPTPWMTDVVSGKPWLVRDGVVQGGWVSPGHISTRHPRTAIGLSRDRHTFYVVVADGRQTHVHGLDGDELANVLASLGAWDAFNLDGGGSSELWIRREGGTVNNPSDGHGRAVGNHLGIRITRRAAFYAARVRAVSPTRDVAPGERVQLAVTVENVGRAPFGVGEGGGGLALVATSPHASALWDPEAWTSARTPAVLAREVRPGEVVTIPFVVQAPIAAGTFHERLALRVPGHGVINGAHADITVRVPQGAVASVGPETVPSEMPAPTVVAPEPVRAATSPMLAASIDTRTVAIGICAGLLALAVSAGRRALARTPARA